MSFTTAIPVAIKVAGMVGDGYKYVREHPEEVQRAMDEAAKATAAAKRLAGDAADLLGVDEAMARARRAADAALDIAAATTSRRNESAEEAEMRIAEEEAAKAVLQARQVVLSGANLRTTLPRLGDMLETENDEELMALMQVLDSPGIFAIATYPKLDLDRDLTDYVGVYVGKAEVVGDGISTAISRAGNPDVYADVKYKQNVVVYVFNCPPDELKYRCNALGEVLGAEQSYNRPLAEA